MDRNNRIQKLTSSRFGQRAANLASSAGTYIASKDYPQLAKSFYSSASQNASDLLGYTNDPNTVIEGTDTITVFPGWAVEKAEESVYKLQLSGYASCLRSIDKATRSQRAFMKLARSFAALPPLPNTTASSQETFSSVEEELEELEASNIPKSEQEQIQLELKAESARTGGSNTAPGRWNEQPRVANMMKPQQLERQQASVPSIPLEKLHTMHANMNKRLQPFWSSILPNRILKLNVYAVWGTPVDRTVDEVPEAKPVATTQVRTNQQGHFEYVFNIKIDNIRRPSWVKDPYQKPIELKIQVDLLPQMLDYSLRPGIVPTPDSVADVTASQILHVKLSSDRGIRVISDLDDTVRTTEIFNGVRAMFRNVFVNDEKEMVIPDIVNWYNNMYKQGIAGFHYVSNSPYEAFSAINDFFNISNLPHGHFKLKYYGGKSLLGGLWEPAAERKRAGVIEILNEFKLCQFILVGDSGEQDLELYSSLARERPNQILAVFIRDVTTPNDKDISKESTGTSSEDVLIPPVPPPRSTKPDLPPMSHIPPIAPKENTCQTKKTPPPPVPPKPSLTPQTHLAPKLPSRSETTPSSSIRSKPSSITLLGSDSEPIEFEAYDAAEAKLMKRIDNFMMRLEKAKMEIPAQVIFCVFKDAREVESITETLLAAQR
ncbi:hypothetical protein E3P81_01580 [Wallemia ichthyophaga]|nr:hypothetical protein E3P97_01581 [Wallemia ichthyophaga]TIB33738.1 hypothetical protein E3P85_01233 [Wallemia ichthyophaga]TIB47683.1 hypothetical protein E3P82_01579 [Wallemia ichthyophaga]TIB52080.1 hypothetical protein E3P81_01580 [Wallemia ichthyophaga]TIB54879.1 hypothetical protein E3P80_01580 [Wallemia ichthyophaga]